MNMVRDKIHWGIQSLASLQLCKGSCCTHRLFHPGKVQERIPAPCFIFIIYTTSHAFSMEPSTDE